MEGGTEAEGAGDEGAGARARGPVEERPEGLAQLPLQGHEDLYDDEPSDAAAVEGDEVLGVGLGADALDARGLPPRLQLWSQSFPSIFFVNELHWIPWTNLPALGGASPPSVAAEAEPEAVGSSRETTETEESSLRCRPRLRRSEHRPQAPPPPSSSGCQQSRRAHFDSRLCWASSGWRPASPGSSRSRTCEPSASIVRKGAGADLVSLAESLAARWRGESLLALRTLGSAPRTRRRRTMARFPFWNPALPSRMPLVREGRLKRRRQSVGRCCQRRRRR